ncbi:hypothetical protein HH308_15295 [Gordonia sp. TBRC 11910]|uniref:Anti-sigma-M factor RsmA n=1 Tax=Gordonia asplenii TaxID=2725283 RepID=A0A848KWB9_9ACTN|nr:hypothetical protein [Gordonia asplenii]NMO02579.1 hypothetical protein [Gordonia asplenii]
MTPFEPGTPSAGATGLPEPPYSPELLADLHADALEPDVAAHVRARIVDDPAAQETLASLDRTRAILRRLPVVERELPPAVRAATDRTLATIAADQRRRSARQRRVRAVAVAASLLIVAAIAPTAWRVTRSDDPATPVARPSSVSPSEAATALSFVGRSTTAPLTMTALRRCTAANGVPASTPVVGSGEARIREQPSIVILLATRHAGRFDVLIVALDCDTGNPATIARSTIGA